MNATDVTTADKPARVAHRVVVAVIDSGWDRRIKDSRVRAGIGLIDPTNDLMHRRSDDDHDELGHGTTCSQLILAAAPEATILPIRVFGTRLETSVEQLCEALRIAEEHGVQVVNLSLATRRSDALVPLYAACERAWKCGITVVAAADRRSKLGYPAVFANVIGVRAGKVSSALGYQYRPDDAIDFVAPGSPFETSPVRAAGAGSNSFAAARIAGVVAQLISETAFGPESVRQRLATQALSEPGAIAQLTQLASPLSE